MIHTAVTVVKKYWNFTTLRPAQQQVIDAILDNKEVVVLLPTGGGKSLCYQLPTLMREGICIVVSPLVALMQDQVLSLQRKGIKAMALSGGVSYEDLDALLDNCIYGNYKFLYLSPERLQQELIQERIRLMPVSLVAIDEAHCISQWGHDFRPAYRSIQILRTLLPEVSFVALTATATKTVVADIIANLKLQNAEIIQQSFYRKNLGYMVYQVADKRYKLKQILDRKYGSAIVYVRNRKETQILSTYITDLGYASDFYHGGISLEEKKQKLVNWQQNRCTIMVATNAFGMGMTNRMYESSCIWTSQKV